MLVTEASLQEPGRYFGGKLSSGPQIHAAIVPPGIGVVATPAALAGAIIIVPVMPVPRLWVVTLMAPVVLVWILLTYLDVVVDDSQPHAPPAGRALGVFCTVSVMEVRQVDAAKTTSDTLARAL